MNVNLYTITTDHLNNDTIEPHKYNCASYFLNNFSNTFSSSSNLLSYLHINIRSIAKHFDEMVSFLNTLHGDFLFLGLSETWLHPNSNNCLYQIPSYQLITSNRENTKGGGVALYIHDFLTFTHIQAINMMHCESIFVENLINNKKGVIGVNYRKPNTSFPEFLASLDECLHQLSARGGHCIILGDMNIDTSGDNTHAAPYQTLLSSYNFAQIITQPTRITDHSNTIIDHLLTNITDYYIESGTIQSDITDHFPIFGIVNNFEHVFKTDTSFFKYNFNSYNPEAFLADLDNLNWHTVYDCMDANQAYVAFYDTFYDIASKHLPIKLSRYKSKNIRKPWLSKGIMISIRKKHKLFAKLKNNPNNVNLKNYYKLYRNRLTKILKSARKTYHSNKIFNSNGNSSQMWRAINEILCKSKSKNAPKKLNNPDPNKSHLTKSGDIAEAFNSYFTNIGPVFDQYLSNIIPSSFFFRPVCYSDVLTAINSLDPKKSAGQDWIHPKLVIDAAEIIARPLTHIINISLSQGVFPDPLKIAKILPIYKKRFNYGG